MIKPISTIGILGAGTMGFGIIQLAATAGANVLVYDTFPEALDNVKPKLAKNLERLVEKGRFKADEVKPLLDRVAICPALEDFSSADLVIEAVIEDLSIKKGLFHKLEKALAADGILATNTSSLPVSAIAAGCHKPERVIGIHFFNPAPVMPLVEIIPGLLTAPDVVTRSRALVDSWGKSTVLAKDTPGFIVNRIARPFYGEALRVLEEGVADSATIDWAMRELGGFKMGPFELMDFIGNDVNYKVTESVFEAFYYDSRFKPSLIQKRLVEANLFGRKTGRGFYDYREGAVPPAPKKDSALGAVIFRRILALLINEAADAVFLQIASVQDIDTAMVKGVNYPKGLLQWADELGITTVLGDLERLFAEYGEDRYRPCPLLRRMAKSQLKFYPQ